MFEVRTQSPMDEHWEERDRALYLIAGESDFSGASNETRDHGWVVSTFASAVFLRTAMGAVKGVTATIREC